MLASKSQLSRLKTFKNVINKNNLEYYQQLKPSRYNLMFLLSKNEPKFICCHFVMRYQCRFVSFFGASIIGKIINNKKN